MDQRIVAKLLRRLADYIDDNGIERAMGLLLPKVREKDDLRFQPRATDALAQASSPSAPQENPPGRRLIPVSKWLEYHDWPPTGGLRHLIFYSEYNGFDKVIRRVGRKVLIDEQAFFEWVDTDASKRWKVEPQKRKGRR